MEVRMRTTAAGPGGLWPADSVQDLDPERAEALIAGGFAVAVERETQGQRPEQATETATDAADEDEQPASRSRRKK